MRALRDNPVAIAEGDVTAPRVNAIAQEAQYLIAQRTTTQNVASIGTAVIAPNVVDNPSGTFNGTNQRFAPTKPGIYLATMSVGGTSPTGGTAAMFAGIRKNGVMIASSQYPAAASTAYGVSASMLVSMNGTTDYLEAVAGQNSLTSSWTITTATFTVTGLNRI